MWCVCREPRRRGKKLSPQLGVWELSCADDSRFSGSEIPPLHSHGRPHLALDVVHLVVFDVAPLVEEAFIHAPGPKQKDVVVLGDDAVDLEMEE